jgi:hypothetical protein
MVFAVGFSYSSIDADADADADAGSVRAGVESAILPANDALGEDQSLHDPCEELAFARADE